MSNYFFELANAPFYFDSRRVTKGGVFFALKGQKRDGHEFVENALRNGAAYCFVRNDFNTQDLEKKYPGVKFIFSENPLRELQVLAKYRRKLFQKPVVAVTGSNGKTIVKEWLFQLLCKKYHVAKSPKSYNSQIGVPLSAWHLRPEHDLAVFEAGISMPGEMALLENILRPEIGIFTNIGTAHEANFDNTEHKIREKMMLFRHSRKLILRENLYERYKGCFDEYAGLQKVVWGAGENCDYSVHFLPKTHPQSANDPLLVIKSDPATLAEKEVSGDRCLIFSQRENTFFSFEMPFPDAASTENLLHVVVLCLEEKWLTPEEIVKNIKTLQRIEMRLQCREGSNNCLIVDDTYNNDYAGLEVALDFMLLHASGRTKTVILTDPEQTLTQAALQANQIEKLLLGKGIEKALIVSNKQDFRFEEIPTLYYPDVTELKRAFQNKMLEIRNEVVLVKGARDYHLEEAVEMLVSPHHGAVLEINLNAIAENLQYYRSELSPHTALMCMVKASAYGSSYEIAHLLAYHGVEYLGVAYAEEGVSLREAGVQLPIMVMNISPDNFSHVTDYGLEPSIFCAEIFRDFGNYLKMRKKRARVHLEFDTGMKRLGFEEADLGRLAELSDEFRDEIEIFACFTHLAASESEEHDAFTHHQVREFLGMADFLERHLSKKVKKHVLNSAGISRFKAYHFDMVRLGIGLYGIETTEQTKGKLRQAATLKATITQIRKLKAGESVGYGRNFVAPKDMILGTISIGYADGYGRRFGNGVGSVYYQNRLCTVVGNVCMDMCMVDLSGTEPKTGDKVVIFGDIPSVNDLANAAGTIAYEVLSQIGSRVKRVFFEN